MDIISKYQQIIEKIIGDYAKLRYSYSEVERRTVFDREQKHYLLMILGVEGHKMVHGCILHLEIRDDKIWISSMYASQTNRSKNYYLLP